MSIVHHFFDENAFWGSFAAQRKLAKSTKCGVLSALTTLDVGELHSIRAHLNGVTFSAASSQAP